MSYGAVGTDAAGVGGCEATTAEADGEGGSVAALSGAGGTAARFCKAVAERSPRSQSADAPISATRRRSAA